MTDMDFVLSAVDVNDKRLLPLALAASFFVE
jgi:hypothetical protein